MKANLGCPRTTQVWHKQQHKTKGIDCMRLSILLSPPPLILPPPLPFPPSVDQGARVDGRGFRFHFSFFFFLHRFTLKYNTWLSTNNEMNNYVQEEFMPSLCKHYCQHTRQHQDRMALWGIRCFFR